MLDMCYRKCLEVFLWKKNIYYENQNPKPLSNESNLVVFYFQNVFQQLIFIECVSKLQVNNRFHLPQKEIESLILTQSVCVLFADLQSKPLNITTIQFGTGNAPHLPHPKESNFQNFKSTYYYLRRKPYWAFWLRQELLHRNHFCTILKCKRIVFLMISA